MANSMESRPAFLDHNVAQAAVNIPPDIRIKDGVEKWVLREAMKNILPEILYKREKFAFMAPPAHTREGKRKAVQVMINDYLSASKINQAGIFDSGKIKNFLNEYEKDTDSVSLVRKDALLNHILCLQILHDQFVA